MKKLGLLAAVCGAAAFGVVGVAAAVPLVNAATGIGATESGLVQPVHGCHSGVAVDEYGPHYNLVNRPGCPRVDAGGRRRGYYEPGYERGYGPGYDRGVVVVPEPYYRRRNC